MNTKTKTFVEPEHQITTLAWLVRPLADLLNRKYAGNEENEFEVVSPGQCEDIPVEANQVALPLFDMPPLAARAVASLLAWNNLGLTAPLGRHHERSLHFHVVKRTFGLGDRRLCLTNLMVEHEGKLNVDVAVAQLAQLAARLEDPEQLVPLTLKEQAELF